MPISNAKTESTAFKICGILGSENIPDAMMQTIMHSRHNKSSITTGKSNAKMAITA